jgi:hypothetical protein
VLWTPAVDAAVFQMGLAVLTGWLDRQERQAVAYLIEENRVLRRQLGKRRLQFTEAERRRLAVRGHQLGRQVLRKIGAGTTGSPMTYRFQGRQYVVVAIGSTNHPAELVALAL